jgi:signal transduction histidine kinase
MGEPEFEIFTVMINLILLVFIGGIIVFFLKYHKRKLISENEKAVLREQHAHELLNLKLEIQQLTMQDIGREIHDNVGQLLTVASIYASQMVYDNTCPSENERINAIWKTVDQSLSELRSLSKNLTEERADMTDLLDLVQNDIDRINQLNICTVICTYHEIKFTISSAVKNFVLRIIQEFIQNSLKHAHCKNIVLDFNHSVDGLAIHIHDDGQGFDMLAGANDKDRGIGLKNMKKRAEMIGASFTFNSILNSGTSLDIFIPVNKLNLS